MFGLTIHNSSARVELTLLIMWFLLAVACILNLANGQQAPNTTQAAPAIIYGSPAEEGEIPFQTLLFNANNGSTSGTRCGGALIRQNWVLTAAHCVTGNDFSTVSMGSVRVDSMTFSSTSYQRFVHPDYMRGPLLNDIALIKLPESAQGMNIDVVAMPASTIGDLAGQPSVVSGFGVTEQGTVSDVLLRADLMIVSNDQCSETPPPTKVCARWTAREGQSSCFGDSGGPLTVQSNGVTTVIGVVSHGGISGQCDSGEDSVYTRVSEYLDWIDMTIANNP